MAEGKPPRNRHVSVGLEADTNRLERVVSSPVHITESAAKSDGLHEAKMHWSHNSLQRYNSVNWSCRGCVLYGCSPRGKAKSFVYFDFVIH